MTASQFWRSWDSCQRNVTGCFATCWIVQKASWSQFEPGNTRTPNFMTQKVYHVKTPNTHAGWSTHIAHRKRAEELDRSAGTGLARSWIVVVRWIVFVGCPIGSAVGP